MASQDKLPTSMQVTVQADEVPASYYVTAGRRVSDGSQVVFGANEILYAAPVRTKDLTDDEIENAVGLPMTKAELSDCRAVIAAYKAKNTLDK